MRQANRRIRVFISSTFRDMIEERNALMTHAWPALRRLCQERQVELVEVDLRWGISESQSTRRETLKLCLDEIRACRPFFIGLLGERYGWTPDDSDYSADLQEEQPWLAGLRGKSATELEILHGVLNHPDMAGRAFFYFRDPAYAQGRGPDFISDQEADAEKQAALKTLIKGVCEAQSIPLRLDYPDPRRLAAMVVADLAAAIENQFPKENIPDALTREAQGHEAFSEMRRRTYIARAEYYAALDRHAAGDGSPLLVLGGSGSGKSALLANWLVHWTEDHPGDFIVRHHIGGAADSADHWRLMARVIAEIKRWSQDPSDLPATHDDIRKEFPLWLAKAGARAAHERVRFILVLDALNQLDDQDHARLLGWLPERPFSGPLRLIVSTLPGAPGSDDPLEAVRKRGWPELRIEPLTVEERRRIIIDYLARFGKKLDEPRLDRLARDAAAANPLYLKILLDDLRVTGTHDRLDSRLTEYLAAADIPALLQQVLTRYQRDYEHDRKGLVGEALGLMYASRRGLSEAELLRLLRPVDQPQLPPAVWSPLRAALEDSLVDRGGILNFAHDFLRLAAGSAFAGDEKRLAVLRLQLADYFEAQPIVARACDELPWLLRETGSLPRLRACLLQIDRFLLIDERDKEELRGYWIEQLHEQRTMGQDYLESFETWSREPERTDKRISYAANQLGLFLFNAALYVEAEPLLRRALALAADLWGKDHPNVTKPLGNLALLLGVVNRLDEAEPLMRRALEIDERSFGVDHPAVARDLNILAELLTPSSRLAEAEPLLRRALAIAEGRLGHDHPHVATVLGNLAKLLQAVNQPAEAELLMRRAIEISERSSGPDHPDVAVALSFLARLFYDTNRLSEAEPLMRRALAIAERSLGMTHPNVAIDLSNLAMLLKDTGRLAEAEPLMRRALEIAEASLGKDHPNVAVDLNNLATLLKADHRLAEAEPLYRRALEVTERAYGKDHADLAVKLNNLAMLLQAANRFDEAESLMRRMMEILLKSSLEAGNLHPYLEAALNNYEALLRGLGRSQEDIMVLLHEMAPEIFPGH